MTGADTNYAVRQDVIDAVKLQLGGKPLFWGRYFKSPSTAGGAQYKGSLENSLLHSNNILVRRCHRNRIGFRAVPSRPTERRMTQRTSRKIFRKRSAGAPSATASGSRGTSSMPAVCRNPCGAIMRFRRASRTECRCSPGNFQPNGVGTDCSIVNPNCVQQLTDGLILPPAPALPPVVAALAEAAPVSATRYADALQGTFDQLVGKANASKLPDGRPFFFPDGQRLGVHVSGSKKRTYGSYQVFQEGRALDGLSGFICECIGPGENTVPGS
jgi:hypothetical protein